MCRENCIHCAGADRTYRAGNTRGSWRVDIAVLSRHQIFINILWIVSALGIVALGQTILLITGNFDMSVAYTVGLAGIVTVMAQISGRACCFQSSLVLVIVGIVNGTIVAITGENPFLVTLGTSTLVYSVNLTITQAKTWHAMISGFVKTRQASF